MGALGPSGPFERYGSVESGRVRGPLTAERVGVLAAVTAPGEVEGYGATGAGGGASGVGASAAPRLREATLGGPRCAPLALTQAHNIGKDPATNLLLFYYYQRIL